MWLIIYCVMVKLLPGNPSHALCPSLSTAPWDDHKKGDPALPARSLFLKSCWIVKICKNVVKNHHKPPVFLGMVTIKKSSIIYKNCVFPGGIVYDCFTHILHIWWYPGLKSTTLEQPMNQHRCNQSPMVISIQGLSGHPRHFYCTIRSFALAVQRSVAVVGAIERSGAGPEKEKVSRTGHGWGI